MCIFLKSWSEGINKLFWDIGILSHFNKYFIRTADDLQNAHNKTEILMYICQYNLFMINTAMIFSCVRSARL